ncbi:MAG: hypothetical protein M5U34_06675 [Chloroflexi bacterium]|nr:hypothetical protein [Chloroflexota bacterium]
MGSPLARGFDGAVPRAGTWRCPSLAAYWSVTGWIVGWEQTLFLRWGCWFWAWPLAITMWPVSFNANTVNINSVGWIRKNKQEEKSEE